MAETVNISQGFIQFVNQSSIEYPMNDNHNEEDYYLSVIPITDASPENYYNEVASATRNVEETFANIAVNAYYQNNYLYISASAPFNGQMTYKLISITWGNINV